MFHIDTIFGDYAALGEPHETYSIQNATTMPEIEALRPIWAKLSNSLDTDIDFYIHELSQNSDTQEPYALVVYEQAVAVAMLVGRVKKKRASAVVSFVNIPGPAERVLEIKRGGRMGRESRAIDRLVACELLKMVRYGAVDSLCFERMALNSGLFREMKNLQGSVVKERIAHTFYYSLLSLSAAGHSATEPGFSGKIAHEIRRKGRILERAFPGQVNVKCYSQTDDLEIGIADAMKIAAGTWQHYLGVGLVDSNRTREDLHFFAKQGWLRIFVLYINDAPCAFLIGQHYGDTFYCQYAGYDPNYTKYSVGFMLTARAFGALVARGVATVDLGEGGQEHNRRLGCELLPEGTVHVYSPTVRGMWLSLFFGVVHYIRRGGRRTQSALRLNRLSLVWRRYLLARRRSGAYPATSQRHLSIRVGRKHV